MEIYKNSWDAPDHYATDDNKQFEVFDEENGILPVLNQYNFVNENNKKLTIDDICPPAKGASQKIFYKKANDNNSFFGLVDYCWNNSDARFEMGFYNIGYNSSLAHENRYIGNKYSYIYRNYNTATSACRCYLILIPTLDGVLMYITPNYAYNQGENGKTWSNFQLNNWFFNQVDDGISNYGLALYFLFTHNSTIKSFIFTAIGGSSDSQTIYYESGISRALFNWNKNETTVKSNLTNEYNHLNSTFPYYESVKDSHNNWDYVNYNSNTCILTKVLYNNQFIDNLYYIITSPFNFPYTGGNADKYNYNIFSFNGHTYFNFYGNLAVEIPN